MSTVLAQVEAILETLPAALFEDAPEATVPHWSETEWNTGLVAASLPPRRSGLARRLPWRRS